MVYDERYYRWLISFIQSENYDQEKSYETLFAQLLDTDFVYTYPMDENRAIDGMDLRIHFLEENRLPQNYFGYYIHKPCSILEMMIALSHRIEIYIMGDEDLGDRTYKWFWDMIRSLGLIHCTDDSYDPNYVSVVLEDFLMRNNEPNGQGGLFTIEENVDIRDMEIWYQMQHYLNYIMERRLV